MENGIHKHSQKFLTVKLPCHSKRLQRNTTLEEVAEEYYGGTSKVANAISGYPRSAPERGGRCRIKEIAVRYKRVFDPEHGIY